ncbi:MAG: hypothetical protein Q7T12_00030 [Flavobacterium sp.]|nr:hypothetical protein [Flavobacterium sp.]
MKKIIFLFIALTFIGCNNQKSLVNKIVLNKNTIASVNPIIVNKKLTFGSGYNSSSGHEFFSVLNYQNTNESTEIISNANGSSGFTDLEIVDNKEKLRDVLDIDRSIEIKVSYLGAKASLNQKEKIYEETEVNKFNQIAITKAKYTNEPRVIINPSVRKELINLAKKSPEEFMLTAGDMFVSKIYTGGTLYGVFELNQRSISEIRKNEKFLKATASYLKNSVSYQTDIKKVKETFENTSKVKTLIITEGGKKPTPSTEGLEAFLQYTSDFKPDVTTDGGSPIVLYVQLEPYENISGFPKIDFSPIRVIQKGFLDKSQDIYDRIDKSISNAKFVTDIKNSVVFNQITIDSAKAKIIEYESNKTKLDFITNNARNDFRKLDTITLNKLNLIKIYEPEYDYSDRPYNETFVLNATYEQQKLISDSGNPNDNTNFSGKYLFIEGELGSTINGTTGTETPMSISYNWKYDFFKKISFGIKTYVGFTQPYYQVIFRDKDDSNKIVYNKPWTGEPVAIYKNVSVEVNLINPDKMYYYMKRGTYVPLQYDNRYGFVKEPKYIYPRISNKIPMAKIYDKLNQNGIINKSSLNNQYLDKNEDYLYFDFDKIDKEFKN